MTNDWILFVTIIIICILLLFFQKIFKNTTEGYAITLILLFLQFLTLYANTILNFKSINLPLIIKKFFFAIIALIILIYHLFERHKQI